MNAARVSEERDDTNRHTQRGAVAQVESLAFGKDRRLGII